MQGRKILEALIRTLNERSKANESAIKRALPGFGSSELFCVAYIGRNSDVNVTKLAAAVGMTRGAISKLAKRMQDNGMIECYQREENKKEVHYVLTDQGWQVYLKLQDLNRKADERDRAFFETICKEDADALERFVDGYHAYLEKLLKEKE